MAKTIFSYPVILSGGLTPGGGGEEVPGSAQNGLDPLNAVPCNYSYWMNNYPADHTDDGITNENDYVSWWSAIMNAGNPEFTLEAFKALNPGWSGPFPNVN